MAFIVAYAAVCIPHCYSPKIDETVAFRWSIKTASHCVSLWLNMKPIANKLHIAWKCHSLSRRSYFAGVLKDRKHWARLSNFHSLNLVIKKKGK